MPAYAKDKGGVEILSALEQSSDDEVRALLKTVLTKSVKKVRFGIGFTAKGAERLASLASTEHRLALWTKLRELGGEWFVLPYLGDDELRTVAEADDDRRVSSGCMRFELMRRGLYDQVRLERDLAIVDGYDKYASRLASLFRARQGEVAALEAARRHAEPFVPMLRAWVLGRRDDPREKLFDFDALFLFVVVHDEAAIDWLAQRCNENAASFKKAYEAEQLAVALAAALSSGPDGERILAALRDRLEGKVFAEVIAQAEAKLATRRAQSGAASPSAMSWGRTPTTTAADVLATVPDQLAFAARAFDDPDPVAHLNALLTVLALEARKPWGERAASDALRAFVQRALTALEASYTEAAPDGKELDKRLGGVMKARLRFGQALEGWLAAAQSDGFVEQVIVPLYVASKNRVFRHWVEPTLRRHSPRHVESTRARFERLAAALSTQTPTAPTTLVFRGNQAPGAQVVNRLFGPPIGVPPEKVPRFDGKPMAHLLTLETRALAGDARAYYESENVAAIAVFLTSLDGHAAFAPDTDHAAVLPLTADDMRIPATVSSSHDARESGVSLEVVTAELPQRLFEGGAKEGALWEMRRLLDGRDFIAPFRRSPRWVQAPQEAGLFLFEVDSSFADEVNLGDEGRLFVFDRTAFAQSG